MSKNLILLQNGFPGSNTSGTEVTSLDIKNFFKYEKNVTSTSYSRVHTGELGTSYDITKHYAEHDTFSKLCRDLQYYEPDTGYYKPNTSFKHYSIMPFLFAVRMKKGFLSAATRRNRSGLQRGSLMVSSVVMESGKSRMMTTRANGVKLTGQAGEWKDSPDKRRATGLLTTRRCIFLVSIASSKG